MRLRLPWLLVLGLAVSLRVGDPPAAATAQPRGSRIGVQGDRFTIDGRTRFVLGVSLFDALGPVPPSEEDLSAIRAWGIDCVRVWAHWRDPIYAQDGSLRPEGRQRLERLLDRLRTRSLVLELVLLRPGQLPGEPFALFESREARYRAASEVARALKGRPDVFFDLYNEHDHPAGSISHEEARRLRDAVKAEDPDRLVTLSSTGSHFWEPDGTMGPNGLAELRGESGTGPGEAAVDIVAVHLPRTPDWAQATHARVWAFERAIHAVGPDRPLYLSEENRARDEQVLSASQYVTALANARSAGAAGWVFHTEAGFDLRKRSFRAGLNAEERRALDSLRSVLGR